MIGLVSFILLMIVIIAALLQSIVKDNKHHIQQCDGFMDVFTTMLNDEARSILKLSKENLRNLYTALSSTAMAVSKIEEASAETEMSLISVAIVDRLNRFAIQRTEVKKQLARIEEEIFVRITAETELEEETIELTELEEETIEFIELIEPKPMVKRRWGEDRVATPTKTSNKDKGGSHEDDIPFTVYSAAASAKPIKR
jgi:hypothetical protein